MTSFATEWRVFLAGRADVYIPVYLDEEIYDALCKAQKLSWQALLEYVQGHERAHEDS